MTQHAYQPGEGSPWGPTSGYQCVYGCQAEEAQLRRPWSDLTILFRSARTSASAVSCRTRGGGWVEVEWLPRLDILEGDGELPG